MPEAVAKQVGVPNINACMQKREAVKWQGVARIRATPHYGVNVKTLLQWALQPKPHHARSCLTLSLSRILYLSNPRLALLETSIEKGALNLKDKQSKLNVLPAKALHLGNNNIAKIEGREPFPVGLGS